MLNSEAREDRLAQHLADERQHRGQILARRLDVDAELRRRRRRRSTRAFSRSNSSLICWRVCLLVPRMSMSAVATPAVERFISDFSSPKRSVP